MMTKLKQTTRTLLASLAVCISIVACSKKPQEPAGAAQASSATPAAVTPSAQPVVASPEACQACIAKTPCAQLPECATLAGDDRAECEAVQQCVQTSNCADGKDTFTNCFCGSLKMSDCVAAPKSGKGAPAGACAAVIRKSLGGEEASNRQVLAHFTRTKFAGGTAIARMNCSKTKGCSAECGF
jgi:hypothetical protein